MCPTSIETTAPAPIAASTLQLSVKKTVAEFFAGIGLVRLALEQAGWQVLFANDFDPKKYTMYASYFPDAPLHYSQSDIFALDPAQVPDTLLATASFPCIDLSLAGSMQGLAGKHSSAFWGFIRLLQAKQERRPPLVLIENVPGWLTSNQGRDFRATIEALNQLGYACDVLSLDAIHFSPQSRLRIFVVGVQTDDATANILSLYQRPASLTAKVVKDAILRNSDLRWNFLDIPVPTPSTMSLQAIVEELSEGDARWWSDVEVKRHIAMMAPEHQARVKRLAESRMWVYRTMYRRRREGFSRAEVRNDDKAGCLRTARGGSSRQMLVGGCNGVIKMRHMTPREYARLQGVPDDYPLPDNTIQALNGFGDAVSVPVVVWIAHHVLNPLTEQMFAASHSG